MSVGACKDCGRVTQLHSRFGTCPGCSLPRLRAERSAPRGGGSSGRSDERAKRNADKGGAQG